MENNKTDDNGKSRGGSLSCCIKPDVADTQGEDSSNLQGFLKFMEYRRGSESNPVNAGPSSSPMDQVRGSFTPSIPKILPPRVSGGALSTLNLHGGNVHVVPDLYYGHVGKPQDKVTWKPYDKTAFTTVKRDLGKGKFSKIHLMLHISSGYLGVMKVMSPQRVLSARNELKILAELSDSPFIIQLIDAFQFADTTCIFLEYAPFKSLDDLIQLTGGIGPQKSAQYALELLLAIQYLHSHHILHRDIKPENALLLINGHVKLGDFSISVVLDSNVKMPMGPCCAFVTRPPEVWAQNYYSYPVDLWAYGVTVFNIISNNWPFVHASEKKQIAHVKEGGIVFSHKFTPLAADLIKRVTQPNPQERWTADRLISHGYFSNLKDPFPPPYLPSELLEIYSLRTDSKNTLEDLPFVHDMVANLTL